MGLFLRLNIQVLKICETLLAPIGSYRLWLNTLQSRAGTDSCVMKSSAHKFHKLGSSLI
jgi:hypothetical protein